MLAAAAAGREGEDSQRGGGVGTVHCRLRYDREADGRL